MATIKSYTDLSQSKNLAKILPLESADMWWAWYSNPLSNGHYDDFPMFYKPICNPNESVPCWSLASLLDIIKKTIGYTLQTTYNKDPKVFIVCELGDKPYSIASLEYDNEVDACVEMILKLHELNLL